jgi:hypothetical protein
MNFSKATGPISREKFEIQVAQCPPNTLDGNNKLRIGFGSRKDAKSLRDGILSIAFSNRLA